MIYESRGQCYLSFLRWAIPDLFFFIFIFSIVQFADKILPKSGFKPGILVLEVTALPTETQPQP